MDTQKPDHKNIKNIQKYMQHQKWQVPLSLKTAQLHWYWKQRLSKYKSKVGFLGCLTKQSKLKSSYLNHVLINFCGEKMINHPVKDWPFDNRLEFLT